MHVAPVMENNSRHNTSTMTELASEPPTLGTIAHKHTHQEKDSSIRYTISQDNTSPNNNVHTSNEYLISLPTHNKERQKHNDMRNYQPIPTRVTRTARKPRISRGKWTICIID